MEYIIFPIVIIMILVIASRAIIKKEEPAKVAFKPVSKNFDNSRGVIQGLFDYSKNWVREYGQSVFKYVDIRPDANEYTWNETEGYHKRNDDERTYVAGKEIDNYGIHDNLFVIPLVYIWKNCICLVHVVDGGGTLRYMNDNLVMTTKKGEFLSYSQDFSADGQLDLTMFKNYAKTLGFSEDAIVEVFYGVSKRTDLSKISKDYDCKVITAYNPSQLIAEMVRIDSQYNVAISKENAVAIVNNFSDKHNLTFFEGPVVYGNVVTPVTNGKILFKKSLLENCDDIGAHLAAKEIRVRATDKEALDKMDGVYGKASKILASEKDIEAHEKMPTLYLKKKNGVATVSEDPFWERKTSEMSKKSLNNNNTKNNNSNQRSLLHGNPPSVFSRAAAVKNGNNNDSMKIEHRNDGFTYIGPYKFPTHEFLKNQVNVEDMYLK